jgi:hypothetical protein
MTQRFSSNTLPWLSTFLITCFLALSSLPVFAEPASSAAPPKPAASADVHLDKDYAKSYLTDTAAILTSPARWDSKDWFTASLVVGAAIGLYSYDQDIQEWSQRQKGTTTDFLDRVSKPFGEGMYFLPAIGLLYLYGKASDDGKAERTSLLAMESVLLSGAFAQVLQHATHRYRPTEGRYDRWDGPGFSLDHLSFPSGHATAVFSLATVIASEYDNAFVPPIAYTIAGLVSLARIQDNKHWASDVFLASAIGYFTAKAVLFYHQKKSPVRVMPLITGQGAGIGLSYSF